MQRFKDWWDRPFRLEMSAWGWLLFLGFLILAMMAWREILSLIKGGN